MKSSLKPRYVIDPSTKCWVWQLAKQKDGYGIVHVAGRTMLAHRHYWESERGPIERGLEIDHVCHTRACVNPNHMRVVTHQINTQNRREGRGRSKHRGVSWHTKNSCWMAKVMVNGRAHYLGSFDDEEEAARVATEFRLSMMPGALS